MNFTLESLMDNLEKQASLTKVAADDPEKKEKNAESKAQEEISDAKKKLENAADSVGKAKSHNAEEQNENEECTKEASAQGAELARAVMQKAASVKINTTVNQEDNMNKQAAAIGKSLADELLTKLAAAGDENTGNGVAPGSVPQKAILDSAQIVAEDNAKVKPLPGTDGMGDGGTVNQIFDAIVQDAAGQGAASYDQVAPVGASRVEGSAEVAVPNQVENGELVPPGDENDEQEKAAAVSHLVAEGFDFNDAVSMVKAAADALEQEKQDQVKQAALARFLQHGYDFDQAVALVKQASVMSSLKGAAGRVAGNLGHDAGLVGVQSKALMGAKGSAKMNAAKDLARNRAVQAGVAGAALAGGAAAALGREKKAAVDQLVAYGVDFDSAVDLVNAKSYELYGM